MEHILATTIYHGVADANSFRTDLLVNQNLSALREKVVITSYKPKPVWPNDRPARVTLELTDGTLITEQCLNAKGGPGSPISQIEINAKISNILSGEYPRLQRIISGIISLEDNIIKSKWCDLINTEENR
jgi:2-methylcitrate dehydratase PrpD